MALVAISPALDKVGREVVDSAFSVHVALGPGLLESVYERCLKHELTSRGMNCECQVILPVTYRGLKLESGLRLDMLVEGEVVVEVKAIDAFQPVHHSQLLTYLRLSSLRLGYLINFNVPLIKQGIRRLVN